MINDTTLFTIDADNGTIVLQAPGLDFEMNTTHNLTVEAYNSLSDHFSATARVTIRVMDGNDNVPIFQQSEYRFNVTEYAPLQQLIGMVIAIDTDATTNEIITYATTSTVIDVGVNYGLWKV